jgi:hypothetical protein
MPASADRTARATVTGSTANEHRRRAHATARTHAAQASQANQAPFTAADDGHGAVTQRDALRLQLLIGNAAVTELLQRNGSIAPVTAAAPPKPGAVQGYEVVLTSDPTYTTDPYRKWFSDQVQAKITSWGLAFNPGGVRLATKGTATVMALGWDSSWGAKPTADIDLRMRPIDASAACTAVRALPGWGAVTAEDQTVIDHLLRGQINDLSAAARDNLRAEWVKVTAMKPAEQGKALTALITSKAAKPDVGSEKVAVTPAALALTGPSEKKKYQFRGKKADANSWTASYDDSTTFEVVEPKAYKAGLHNHTAQQAADSARYLPSKNRALIKKIMLNPVTNPDDPFWAKKYKRKNFHSYMTAGGDGIVTIYPDKSTATLPASDDMRGAMIHESGHTWAAKTFGNDQTKGKWKEWRKAMKADRTSVSGYAMSSISEDVAETVQVYHSTNGTPRFAEYRSIAPNRFAMLDKELK